MSRAGSPVRVAQVAALVRPVVETDKRVYFVYLFGSVATGTGREDSDVDLAAYVEPEGTLLDDARLHEALSAALRPHEVDLVILNQAPLWLQFRILGEGSVVFSRSERERITFRERVEKRFLDFRPYHERYLAEIRERARQGLLSRG